MHHDPTPEPAHHHCTAPALALRATPAPAPRMAPSLPLTVLAVALSLVALGTSAAGLALARATRSLQCALTSSILRAPALRRDPPSSLASALVDLARRHRVALFIAPVAAPIARDLPVPDALGDSLRDGVRALDAWASTRGLWLHDDDGVLRLERPVTTANFDCDGALDVCATRLERLAAVTVVRAPGAWELPMVCRTLAKSGRYDAIVAVGAVIRGSTPHFDYVAAEVSKGLASVSLDTGVPVAFGVITTENIEQAIERAGTKAGNKGWDAAMSAIEMISLQKALARHGH